ncbi:ABC transporter permease [Thiobacillus sp.]|uniref:MlaE family ABC transporter permease n=1 Tax=Thiobacillus sp. TaxID=924 RepID=UPI00183703BE|nr:ABC transporter permease [Thiobacillus sp.]MBC2729165.1 ABC transporter permease [Thiobacillus sp.]MBC2737900.1 ABC transporter permease [Thiobacillus sp.]
MNFLAASIESLGAKVVGWFTVGYGMFAFLAKAGLLLLEPATWNRATFDVVVKQVYFTAVQILHVFLGYALVISWLIITIILSTARDFGLTEFASEMTIRVLVLELLPFLTALFVALRSGSAINTEVALMQVNNELDALAHCKVPPMQFEFLPRLIGGVVSVVTLAGLAGLLALLMGYLAIYGMNVAGFEPYTRTIAKIFDFRIMAGMRVFFAIVAIEVVSLALKYI